MARGILIASHNRRKVRGRSAPSLFEHKFDRHKKSRLHFSGFHLQQLNTIDDCYRQNGDDLSLKISSSLVCGIASAFGAKYDTWYFLTSQIMHGRLGKSHILGSTYDCVFGRVYSLDYSYSLKQKVAFSCHFLFKSPSSRSLDHISYLRILVAVSSISKPPGPS